MVRYMTPDETKYCKIVVRHIPVVLDTIMARFSTVYRHLTSKQINICLCNGAFVGEVKNGKIVELTKENYNIIEVEDDVVEEVVDDIVEDTTTENENIIEEEFVPVITINPARPPIKVVPVTKVKEEEPVEEITVDEEDLSDEEFEKLFEEELAKEEAKKENAVE